MMIKVSGKAKSAKISVSDTVLKRVGFVLWQKRNEFSSRTD